MLRRLVDAARADVEDQVGWAAGEAKGQIRHAVTLVVIGVFALAALLGALTVGVVGLHAWLAAVYGPVAAYCGVGGGLLLIALILLLVMQGLRQPPLRPRPSVRLAEPATLVGLAPFGRAANAAAGGDAAKAFADSLGSGPRSNLLAALGLAVVLGLVLGRRGRRSGG